MRDAGGSATYSEAVIANWRGLRININSGLPRLDKSAVERAFRTRWGHRTTELDALAPTVQGRHSERIASALSGKRDSRSGQDTEAEVGHSQRCSNLGGNGTVASNNRKGIGTQRSAVRDLNSRDNASEKVRSQVQCGRGKNARRACGQPLAGEAQSCGVAVDGGSTQTVILRGTPRRCGFRRIVNVEMKAEILRRRCLRAIGYGHIGSQSCLQREHMRGVVTGPDGKRNVL